MTSDIEYAKHHANKLVELMHNIDVQTTKNEAEISRLRIVESNMATIKANINNDNLSPAQFREFMKSFL